MLKPVLVVLTLAQGGNATHLALTSPEDAADCTARATVVRQVLESAGHHVIEARCGETELNFTAYGHGEKRPPHIHAWRVTLPETGAVIEPLSKGEACVPDPAALPAVHCAMSAQSAVR